jgi:serine/threonine protein kinase
VTEAKAIHWIRGALQGLVYLHERGIVHRDVKMENVALAADGSVKLIDFGYASAWDYVSKYTPGTEEYIAPELFTRQPDSACDLRKADVWAAGILLFTLLTAAMDRCVFPWTRADDKSESFKAYRSTGEVPRRPWASFSNTARFLLLNMLKVDPRERCTAAEALAFVNDHWPVAVRSKPSFLRMSSSISTASTDSGFDSDDSFSRISSDRTTTADILRHARLPSIPTPVKVAAVTAPLLPATGGLYDLELLSFGIALPPTPEHSAPLPSKKRKASDSDAKQPSQKRTTKRQRRQPAQQAS